MGDNKFYWLKLKRDFFKRSDIKIIESMPNGKDYVLFYLKLLLESIENEGNLRFSDTIPYDEGMLSTITDTNIDVVRAAMKVLTSTGLIEILDDDTIFMSEVCSMIGSAVNNDNANRQRRFRENKKKANNLLESENTPCVTKSNASVTENITNNNESKSIEKDIELDIDKEKEIYKEREVVEKPKKKKFVPPTLEEVKAYCLEKGLSVNAERFLEYYQAGDWKDAKGNPVKNWKQKIITWNGRNDNNSNRVSNSNKNNNKNCFGEMMEREGVNPQEVIYGTGGDFNFT